MHSSCPSLFKEWLMIFLGVWEINRFLEHFRSDSSGNVVLSLFYHEGHLVNSQDQCPRTTLHWINSSWELWHSLGVWLMKMMMIMMMRIAVSFTLSVTHYIFYCLCLTDIDNHRSIVPPVSRRLYYNNTSGISVADSVNRLFYIFSQFP